MGDGRVWGSVGGWQFNGLMSLMSGDVHHGHGRAEHPPRPADVFLGMPSLAAAVMAALLTFGAVPVSAQTVGPADRPASRTDLNSSIAHGELVEKARRGRIDAYFVGDSIVRRWGALDYPDLLANWNANFFGWNAANFGWGADRIENVLWRLENGELDEVRPKVIVVLAGTNNVGAEPGGEEKIADITRGQQALVALCRRKAPEATVILTAIFPRNDHPAVVPEIVRVNARLAGLADGKKVRFLDINDELADPQGKLYEGMTFDGLHPTLKGYQIWADALKPILVELLGPPAAIDLAPPPTGDPSARRRSPPRGRPPMAIAAGQAAAETSPLTANELAAVVRDVADTTPIVDMHTHLFSSGYGELALWGIDDLLTYRSVRPFRTTASCQPVEPREPARALRVRPQVCQHVAVRLLVFPEQPVDRRRDHARARGDAGHDLHPSAGLVPVPRRRRRRRDPAARSARLRPALPRPSSGGPSARFRTCRR